MKFEYTSVFGTNAKGRLIKRPLVELELIGKRKNLKALGLLDSGADTTMMNLEYAKALDISLDTEKQKEYIGIGGARIPCFLSLITLKVKHFEKPITTAVAFIDSPSVDILLGQEDFFERFRVKFEKDHDVFELSPSPKVRD
ncbi:MAG: hypothetical protein G01um101417_169 [Parcubacteria group bacterium Gr01-1014_17]|nr:MAG: hypothetical protein G01um101417_169 [Parcubacteria group bacterium Gr01-1014_17]